MSFPVSLSSGFPWVAGAGRCIITSDAPRISYFSHERAGIVDFTEAKTELIVANGQPVSIGGATTKMHEVTRQILGFADRTSSSETSLVVTATVQCPRHFNALDGSSAFALI
jgi:hypothetical protein